MTNENKIALLAVLAFAGLMAITNMSSIDRGIEQVEPKYIRSVKINKEHGYEIVSSGKNTNYYIVNSDSSLKRINPNEQIRANIPLRKTIETQVETNYYKYKIETN